MKYTTVFLFLFLFYRSSTATYGVDVSSPISSGSFSCMKNYGYDFAIVRCWQSNGVPDPNCPSTVANAWNGGMSHVDVYMFPCPTCGNPSGQVYNLYNYLVSNGVKYGMLWFDIEGPEYWYGDYSDNINFMQAMINEAITLGFYFGIYTNDYEWTSIMGSWTGGSYYPLWYADYDYAANFNDFYPFNGWTYPNMKQYEGDASVCSCEVDLNWYPSSVELNETEPAIISA